MPVYPFLGESSPIKIDYRKKGTLVLTSLLEDLQLVRPLFCPALLALRELHVRFVAPEAALALLPREGHVQARELVAWCWWHTKAEQTNGTQSTKHSSI